LPYAQKFDSGSAEATDEKWRNKLKLFYPLFSCIMTIRDMPGVASVRDLQFVGNPRW
jgi:hypothetical protein